MGKYLIFGTMFIQVRGWWITPVYCHLTTEEIYMNAWLGPGCLQDSLLVLFWVEEWKIVVFPLFILPKSMWYSYDEIKFREKTKKKKTKKKVGSEVTASAVPHRPWLCARLVWCHNVRLGSGLRCSGMCLHYIPANTKGDCAQGRAMKVLKCTLEH